MLGMGMTLTIPDFKRVALYPKAAAIGLFSQILLLPLIGFAIVLTIPIDPIFGVGLIVIAACPGGALSNLISHLSKGDTALSISLTAISSLITIFTIPLIINLALDVILNSADVNIHLPIGITIFNIVLLTGLPVTIGMSINYFFPKFSKKIERAIPLASGVIIFLALLIVVLNLIKLGSIWGFVKAIFWSVFLLNILMLLAGYGLSRLFGLKSDVAATISIESGMQNVVMGIAITTSANMLDNPLMSAAPGVYGIVMLISGIIVISIFRRTHRKTSNL